MDATVTLKATTTEPAIALPAIGQGTWYMGEGLAPRQDEVRALQQGLDLGLTLIDTAEMYGDGGAEEVVGQSLQGRREQAFLVSKVYPWNAGKRSAIQACEASLTRLGTDYLDLYLLHWPGSIPLEETLAAFEQLRADGKIKRFGISNFDLSEAQEWQALSDPLTGQSTAVNQVLYHLGSRGIEHSLRPWQREQHIPTMGYCPLAQGGSLRRDLLSNSELQAVAKELHISVPQLLLAWAIRPIDGQRDLIAIPKAVQPQHVQQNADALNIQLSDEVLSRLDKAFPAPNRKTSLDIV
ncbi:aldo/keto reductase [Oceanisphaera sp. IT1-181]|uniref:aldo/keto reductase n=1 Tax=Oceanisphaera sp. IT1-181 TaxID=3081199 RepID=UPI0029CA8296|nr:aldo/keto reductase [Oceanisphaera sp. IT1-181]